MSGHGHAPESSNKMIALLIAVIALFLAFSEHFGTAAQNNATEANIRASNLWAFFQAKTIRRNILQTSAEEMEVTLLTVTDAEIRAKMQKRVDDWKATSARLESEPDTGEGRKELAQRAVAAEKIRDSFNVKRKHFDTAAGFLQIAIVMASASIITGIGWLIWLTLGLGGIGAGILALGVSAPTVLRMFFGG